MPILHPLAAHYRHMPITRVLLYFLNDVVTTQPHPQHGGQAGVGQQRVYHRDLHQERDGGQPGGQDRDGHRGQDSPGGGQ